MWIASGLNGRIMDTWAANFILLLVSLMDTILTTQCGHGTEVSPSQGILARGMRYPYYHILTQMILSRLQTFWISGNLAIHMTPSFIVMAAIGRITVVVMMAAVKIRITFLQPKDTLGCDDVLFSQWD